MNPQDRRIAAIRNLVAAHLDANHKVLPGLDPETLVAEIRELSPLGRTGRWINAIGNWEGMVRDPETDVQWALLQGSIFAAHAA